MSNSTKEHQEIIIQNTEIDFTRDQPMEITPYDYQIPVIEKLLEFIDKNAHVPKTTCYVVMPGGSGKTVIFSELIKRLNQRAIILSPTLTISDQNFKTTQIMNPGAKISMFNSFSRDLNGEILFTTYHSMLGLIKRGNLPRDFARVIIFDEGHRALSTERSKIMNHFDAIGIALTATDKYSEEKNVERIFKNELYRMSLKEGIELGILLPLRGFVVETKIDLRSVKLMNRNHLNEQVAEKHLNIIARNNIARDYYLENFKGIPTVMFCVTVKHAVEMAKHLLKSGVRAAAVHAQTDKNERQEILRKFNSGELDVLCSRDVLTEGWNSKRVVVEFNLRPTYSWVLAEQRACRVVRPNEGKKCGIIVEFQDSYGYKDQPIWVHHLFGLRYYRQGGYISAPARYIELEKKAIELGEPIDILKNLKVSSTVREVVNLGSLTSDMKFENKDLIRDILLSRSDVDYFSISKSNFLNLEFNHIAFHGNGRRLIQKHLGRMWQETKEDYELFIADILGNHLYYELFNPETEKIVNIEESLDESAQPIEKLMNESLSIEIDRSLSIFSHRDNEVVSLFFGLTSHMIRHQDSCSMSIKLTLEKAAEKNRELTKSEIEHIQSCKNKIALFSECLDNRTGLSIPDLAKMFDCSPERIRQIKEKVILRLRNNSYMSEKLAYYLDYIPGWYQRQKKRREYKESW